MTPSGLEWRFCGQGLLLLGGKERRISDRVVMSHMRGGFHAGVMAGSDREDVYEDVEEEVVVLPETCPGCGVKIQIEDPDAPGYCRVPKRIMDILTGQVEQEEEEDDIAMDDSDDFEEEIEGDDILIDSNDDDDEAWMKDAENNPDFVRVKLEDGDLGSDDDVEEFNDMIDSLNMMEMNVPQQKGSTQKGREPRPIVFEDDNDADDIFADLVCERCYSLKHYGKIKSSEAEVSLPEFDLAESVGRVIQSRQFRRAVVLIVVDLADFDGSLPRLAIRSLLQSNDTENLSSATPSDFKLVIAANKSDLIPREATSARLEKWVRRRIADGGLPRPSSVHIVSSHTNSGVKSLLIDLQKSVGSKGDVWVVGAQNAGKSSLINAMRKGAGLKPSNVTEAPIPGTTLDIVPIRGIVPKGCEMLDTPGVRHEYQLTARLSAEEVRMLLPKRSLKPRTYRIGEGQTIHLGGIGRIDVCSVPGATLYVTIWASDEVRCHLGKTVNAESLLATHLGKDLVPPVIRSDDDVSRIESMPALTPTDVEVNGDEWKSSSVDVCIAGLGWAGIGVRGKSQLKVWAPPGVAITTRAALIPDMAKEFCKPGFDAASRPKVVKKGKKKRKK
ncbi:hypothetical protein M9435_004910 [Picochlorum sp. BPE23]|nr:hypothetical protein M9435_004910 [Picochlorum sp. BPE23]